jgi:hypothetical protein
MAVVRPIDRRERARRLYLWAAVFVPVVVLVGFARTYYLKGLFDAPALPGVLVHLHGLVMTAWIALFAAQVWLVSSRRTKLHRQLGAVGAVLAVLVILAGVTTAIAAAARGSAPPDVPPLVFLVVPLGDMVVFAILVGAALYYRRRLEIHKRLMLLAVLNMLTPAIARIPLTFIETGGPLVYFGLTDLCVLACVAVDTVTHRRLHPAFLWGALVIVASQPLRLMLGGTAAWMQFATWLVG